MSLLSEVLAGRQIHSVHTDPEVTYIMLTDGTQVTIRGLVIVEPRNRPAQYATSRSLDRKR